jgi:hypothetical protein
LPCPSPGDLPNPGMEPRSPALQADSSPSEAPGKPLYKPSIVNKVWNFFVKYVLKVLLVLLSTGLSVLYYNNKLMKVEHGI